MNWKDEAAGYLKNYGPMRASLESIPLELSRLELEARAIRSSAPRGVPGTRRFDAVEGRLLNNLAMRTQLQFQLDNAKKWVAVAEKAMEALSREDRLVLELMYISPGTGSMQQLCQQLEVEQSSVYRRRDRALQRFATALYGSPS